MKDWFNWQVVQSLLRNLTVFIGGSLVSQGIITEEQNGLLLGFVLAGGALAFSIASARFKKVATEVAGGKEAVKDAIELRKN